MPNVRGHSHSPSQGQGQGCPYCSCLIFLPAFQQLRREFHEGALQAHTGAWAWLQCMEPWEATYGQGLLMGDSANVSSGLPSRGRVCAWAVCNCVDQNRTRGNDLCTARA